MKTYYRKTVKPLLIEEDGKRFELKEGDRVLTSEIRELEGLPVVTVLSTYWITVPASHFEGAEKAYGHVHSMNPPDPKIVTDEALALVDKPYSDSDYTERLKALGLSIPESNDDVIQNERMISRTLAEAVRALRASLANADDNLRKEKARSSELESQVFMRIDKVRVRQCEKGEVWIWQGDGHDHPESITCPIIVPAEQVRAWIAADAEITTLREENERLKLKANCYLDSLKLERETHVEWKAAANAAEAELADLRDRLKTAVGALEKSADLLDEVRTGEDFEVVCSDRAEANREIIKSIKAAKDNAPSSPADAVSIEELRRCVNAACSCGGYGAGETDKACPACMTWHFIRADKSPSAQERTAEAVKGDDECQDCTNKAKHCTEDGVWLCAECYAELVADSAGQEDEPDKPAQPSGREEQKP